MFKISTKSTPTNKGVYLLKQPNNNELNMFNLPKEQKAVLLIFWNLYI